MQKIKLRGRCTASMGLRRNRLIWSCCNFNHQILSLHFSRHNHYFKNLPHTAFTISGGIFNSPGTPFSFASSTPPVIINFIRSTFCFFAFSTCCTALFLYRFDKHRHDSATDHTLCRRDIIGEVYRFHPVTTIFYYLA